MNFPPKTNTRSLGRVCRLLASHSPDLLTILLTGKDMPGEYPLNNIHYTVEFCSMVVVLYRSLVTSLVYSVMLILL